MTSEPNAAAGSVDSGERAAAEGDVLDGRYRLVTLLGRGGFGDVWRADELLPDGTPFRQVALKLLAPHVTDAASWVEEAKLLASFRHPSLVTIYATGVFHGAWPQPFVAMELLEGSTLGDVLNDRGPIAWRRVLAWAREAAAALDVIHERGVVHLDLKPANLFLCKDGTVKVLDFGIARRATSIAVKAHEDPGPPSSRAHSENRSSARSSRKTPEPGFVETGMMPASLPRSSMLSQREAEMNTAAFVAEQSLDAMSTPPPPPAVTAAQQSTPEAFAHTFAISNTDAFARTQHHGSTTARAIIGTPGYMAPEIFEQAEPSCATDAYALAVCIAVLTTGRLPLDVPEEPEGGWSDPTSVTQWWAAVRNATLRGAMRDLRSGPKRLPAGLARVLNRLFSVDPAARGVSPGRLRTLLDEPWERPYGAPESPFAGTLSFTIEHEGWLFGRDEEIARLGRDLEHEPCVVLVGPDACGKTSLALSGLVPHLGKRQVDEKDDFRAILLNDVGRGDAALDEALAQVYTSLKGASIDQLIDHCEKERVGLAFVVDPLEAVAKAPVEKRARLGELLSLAGDGHVRPGLRVIAVVGEDHVNDVQSLAFGPDLRSSLRYVGPPSPPSATAIVTRPMRLLRVDPQGIELVIAEVQREITAPGRLPFVGQALSDLWAARERGAKEKTPNFAQKWKELRGVVGAVARAGDRVLDQMTQADRTLAEEILLFFTGTDGTIVKWSRAELLEAFGRDKGATESVLTSLLSAGILREQNDLYCLCHDGLLTGWRRLQNLRDRHLVRLAFVERLRESTHSWEKSAKSTEALLRGALLSEVLEKPDQMAHGLVAREREFVEASLSFARRQKAFKVAAAILGVVTIVLLFVGKRALDRQRDQARQEQAAAEAKARVLGLVAHARRTDDPFHRVALMAEAIGRGSDDGLLPVELADAVANVPKARFLTLEPVVAPGFDWEDRWLIAGQTSTTLLIADLLPKEPDVIDDVPLDADPDKIKRKTYPTPRVHLLRPYQEPIAERAAFPFDSTFATRSTLGEVRLFRLTDDGEVALAAVAPIKCTGAMHTAERAPVLACASEDGLVAWDPRKKGPDAIHRHPWKGSVADVSPDGKTVVATAERTLFLWKPGGGRTLEVNLNQSIVLAKFSPRDRVVAAVTTTAVEVYNIDEAADPLVRVDRLSHRLDPISTRWDAGGLDLGLCGRDGRAAWIYLRNGGRAKGEPPPAGSPCGAAPGKRVPTRITRSDDLGAFADLVLGSRPALDGFRLPDGRLVTRDLIVFDEPKRVARSLLEFHGLGEDGKEDEGIPGVSVANIVRDGSKVAWQVGAETILFDYATGRRLSGRKGNLLRRCADGKLAGWRKTDRAYKVFDVYTDATIGEVPNDPQLILGIDAKCTSLFTQSLEGEIFARPLGTGEPPKTLALADGYVYDVRLAAERGADGPGLYLLVSSGAIARLDETSRTIRMLTYTTPRATAVADGPSPGEVLFSDATGVLVLRASGSIDRLSETDADVTISDVAAASDGRTVLFLGGQKLHVLDPASGERRAMKVKTVERILNWDEEGTVLLWSNDRVGPPAGTIIPRAKALAKRVAESTSNLSVTEKGDLQIRR
ncbi:MAG: serine/threonine protein kinase [Polyangiaceae bacterium]|nr:serine/threonine protein kinase [Polyangiaceae bacterium]